MDLADEFVILSGYSEFAYAQEAMRQGVSHYLLKPLDRDEVVAVLQEIKGKLDAVFLAEYGFAQEEIENFRKSRILYKENGDNSSGGQKGTWKFTWEGFDEELTSALQLMNYQSARKVVDKLFNYIKSRDISLPEARVIVSSCIYHILRMAYEKNIKIDFVLPEEINGELSLSELKNLILGLISETINLMLENRKTNSKSYLYRVKAYIDQNYSQDLKVSSLAKMEFIEAGYLGETFAKQFGCSINEYINKVRINKAMELIRTTDMKLNDIAYAVGYKSYNNFFSNFKKIANIKPTQFYERYSHSLKKE
ncbi:helix-turn-helix domain-containing protein [Thermoclostridium stercorarium]|nr:helix-turn-helix domain-containing protein [Thermoclostridium stercorarium]UZQ86242.1 helix-turn-helix domain-containing protein [Thermoclostridium stercorarium]